MTTDTKHAGNLFIPDAYISNICSMWTGKYVHATFGQKLFIRPMEVNIPSVPWGGIWVGINRSTQENHRFPRKQRIDQLVGGFNPFEKY